VVEGAEDAGSDLERDLLTFLGAWARLRDRMDWTVKSLLRGRLPELGDVVADRFLGGLRDADRMTFFLAAAKEVDYSGDLTQFTGLFNRAKRIRDLVAHFYQVAVVVSEKDQSHRLQVSYSGDMSEKSTRTLPEPFPPDGFQLLATDCAWLMEHVESVLWANERQSEAERAADSAAPPPRADARQDPLQAGRTLPHGTR
jgi:hypothetical protein